MELQDVLSVGGKGLPTHLEVSETMTVAAALEADTILRSAGTSGEPCKVHAFCLSGTRLDMPVWESCKAACSAVEDSMQPHGALVGQEKFVRTGKKGTWRKTNWEPSRLCGGMVRRKSASIAIFSRCVMTTITRPPSAAYAWQVCGGVRRLSAMPGWQDGACRLAIIGCIIGHLAYSVLTGM